jgi:hypothetical protein
LPLTVDVVAGVLVVLSDVLVESVGAGVTLSEVLVLSVGAGVP